MRKYALTLILITVVLTTTSTCLAVDPNLVSHWKFDEPNGITAFDSAGPNDGTLMNGPVWTTGQIDGALDFDGVDDYVALPDNEPIWLPVNNFTTSCWIYCDRVAGSGNPEYLLDLNFASSGDPDYALGYAVTRDAATGRLTFGVKTTTANVVGPFSSTVIQDNTWYHVAAVRDGTEMSLYIDGVLDSNDVCTGDPVDFVGGYDDNKVNIGRFSYSGSASGLYFFDGKIDDVRLCDRALSGVEIQQLYNEAPLVPVAHWTFDEGSGSTAFDSVGNNDGNLMGDPNWTTGMIGGALEFDGAGDGVYINPSSGTGSNLNIYNTDMTISAWVDGTGSIITRAQTLAIPYWLDVTDVLHSTPYIPYIDVYNSGHTSIGSSDPIILGTWSHVVGVFDRVNNWGYVYVNGILKGDAYMPDGLSISGITTIGCRTDVTNRPFTGKIDDVRLYNKALYDQQVLQIFMDGLTEPYVYISDLRLNFTTAVGYPDPQDQTLSIFNAGPNTIDWDLTHDCNWLTAAPTSGQSSGANDVNDVTLSVDVNGLGWGDYNGTLTVSDPNASNYSQSAHMFLRIYEDPNDCYTGPDYVEWVNVGKPDCWCFPRQCHGDTDGSTEQLGKAIFSIGFNDLTKLINCWQDPQFPPPEIDCRCADFSHSTEAIGKLTYRVGFEDLSIFVLNWQDSLGTPPDCLTDNPAYP